MAKISRNAPCSCGSGKKYKHCCGRLGSEPVRAVTTGTGDKARFQEAVALSRQGDLAGAGRICDELLSKNPSQLDALRLGGIVALQTGQWDKAVSILKRQIALTPNDPVAHCNLGMAYFELGDDDAAYKSNLLSLKQSSRQAEAYNNIGKILQRRHHLEGALEHYQKAVKYGKGNPYYSMNLASVLEATGEEAEAERLYRGILEKQGNFVPAHNNLALILSKKGDFESAQKHFDIVLKADPRNPEIHNNYGLMWKQMKELEKAEECFLHAIDLAPNAANAYINMGLLYALTGRDDESKAYYEKALELDPDNPDVHANLGFQMYALGEQEAAVEQMELALSQNPNHVQALSCFGQILIEDGYLVKATELIEMALRLGANEAPPHRAMARLREKQHETDAAEEEWKRVIELKPEQDEGYVGLAKLYFTLDRYDDARRVYIESEGRIVTSANFYEAWCRLEEHTHNLERAAELAGKAALKSPQDPSLAVLRSTLARRGKSYDEALGFLDEIDADGIRSNRKKSAYLFERGTVLDKMGRYQEAFASYDAANQLKNRYCGNEYDEETDERQFQERRKIFSAQNREYFAQLAAKLPEPVVTPVFILGFPRSGTSLLEQILGSHREIEPAGELTFIQELVGGKAQEIVGSALRYPQCLLDPNRKLTVQMLLEMRDLYLSKLRAMGILQDGTRWITDKMPHNSMHMGLIALLFPSSPIIHISRHPLDSCLSAYFSNFGGHRYTSSLPSTATHYQKVMDLIEYYKQTVTMRFTEMRYQDLIDDQEALVRKLLEFIGADWDENCLQHHKSKRVVRTASYEQVTQKVYRSSLARYINYWDSVQEIIPIVQPTIDRFGYRLKD